MTIDPDLRDRLVERIRTIPIVTTLDMQLDDFDLGYCRMRVPYRREYDGVYESFHGGILMTAADSAACFAIFTHTGPDEVLTTTDMNIRFLAPCLSDLEVRARVVKLGRTLVPVHVDLYDADERHVAIAQVNYIRLPRVPSRPARREQDQ